MSTQPELSAGASRLLWYLRSWAPRRDAAKPDYQIAAQTGLRERDLIDHADELLAAGYLVIAEVAPPKGRWLLNPEENLDAARAYLDTLRSRAIAIFRRRRNLRRAIAAAEARRRVESNGQVRLF